MAYVLKNTEGEIIAASPEVNPGQGWEEIEDNPQDYVKFLEKSLEKSEPFRQSDMQLVRVLEDLINLLIDRSIIRFTDLPMTAQKRLNDRDSMRKKTNLTGLMDDSKDII